MRKIISPSILNVKKEDLKENILLINKMKNIWLHFDVMDGIFVKNTSFKSSLLKEINSYSRLFKDVHLMVNDLNTYINEYVNNGANLITVHYEADKYIGKYLKLIRNNNIKCGIAISPNTKVKDIVKYLDIVDLVLVMSVEPGLGGQKFNDICLSKIEYLNKYRKENKFKYLIEVDGGINKETAKLVKKAGADVLVSGSYIFNNDIKKAIRSLR